MAARLLASVAAMLTLALLVAVPRASAGRSLRLPDGFLIGAGSSAYQIEGGWNASGKGLSVLDRAYGGRPDGGGNTACDSYHRYPEDVAMLKLMKASHYRFSLAWARLLPTGEADNVNPDGVRYYSALLDELGANGIEPVVTLYHEGLPAALDDKFGGWLGAEIVDYFEAYAVTAFRLFGDRVRHWVTLNEPYMFCVFGVGHGRLGASRVRPGSGEYLCGKHMLLAHAKAYRAYKERFAHQGGAVGLTLQNFFTRPCSTSEEDVLAAEAHQQFELGWFLEPLLLGRYPPLMRSRVDARDPAVLPDWAPDQQSLLSGTLDFLGLNVYFGVTACAGVPAGAADPSIERDAAFTLQDVADPFLPPGPFRSTPWALRASLDWLRDRYGGALGVMPVPIVITESGLGDDGSEGLRDASRVAYLKHHIREVLRAVHEGGHNVTGFFAWCLLDDYEWGAGYKMKFGLVHVDFESGSLRRTPKDSLYFMRDLIEGRQLPISSAAPAVLSAVLPTALAVLVVLQRPIRFEVQ